MKSHIIKTEDNFDTTALTLFIIFVPFDPHPVNKVHDLMQLLSSQKGNKNGYYIQHWTDKCVLIFPTLLFCALMLTKIVVS